MRVLLTYDDNTRSLEVVEITDAFYDDDVTNVKDEEGNYDRYNERPIEGFEFCDTDGDWWYIPNLSAITCNNICKELMKNGYADLSGYGEYYEM